MIKETNSSALFAEAQEHLVGGVNSPVRSFRNVGIEPIYFHKGEGPWLTSVEGRKFIDYVLGWGTFILGHSDNDVKSEISKQLELGVHFGSCHELEIEFAKIIKKAFKYINKIRVVNSGTEAVMVAVRLARAFTGRKKILKFSGNYHGHVDYLLVSSGSGLATLNIPLSKGIPLEFINETIVVEYNDTSALEICFDKYGDQIAAVIVEPVAGNMGVVPPKNGFLKTLREVTKIYNSVLIFDEVITGFRFEFGGLSNEYDPDLVILGKIVGGGLPIGVVGGKEEIMNLLVPIGDVYHAGTFSANPLTLIAGIATLRKLMQLNYTYLEELAQIFEEGVISIKNRFNNGKMKFNRYGSMMSIFFNDNEVIDSRTAYNSDRGMYSLFYKFLLERGVYLPPSPFESIFISFSHTINEINYTIDRIEEFFINM
ncbi:MAG: glutamate-1-semialdehyde 2,1-aminomutase [Candidatus Calescibacterium sp.]|nr:glutamate-1-semialdehyde 2,1-aminomutase [Candidatus Calescibacterium sp.]MDW8133049.1 glutamate-1-semialdehyde 2,1-aminomutase [Candidatus Calescibacterium sp.]